MAVSRRSFSKGLLSSAFLALKALPLAALTAPDGAIASLGLNTWSLREMKHDQAIPAILSVMRATGMQNCQLLFSHAEPEQFDPDFAAMFSAAGKMPTQQQREEQKRKSEARTAWRLSVSMTYFEALRARFEQQGLTIRAYGSPFGASAEEIDRTFLIAKTLGAGIVNGRLAQAQTDLVAAAAQRHGLNAGIQVSDPKLAAEQLRTSTYLKADPDLGDLTKAGFSALDFVKEHIDRISSIDLKDAVAGGGSVSFGTGQAPLRDVIAFVTRAGDRTELYIDCDYPGTGSSPEEVKKCVRVVEGMMKTA